MADKAKLHAQISYVKSVVRIIAYVALAMGSLLWAGVGLIAAELLGIAEEVWGA